MDTLITDELKQKEQDRVVRISHNLTDILLEWATGTGKTRAALQIMLEAINGKRTQKPWLILVEEINHMLTWQDELQNFPVLKALFDSQKIILECYASVKKYENSEYNLVMDEVHHAFSDLRYEYLNSIKCDMTISLSATVKKAHKILLKIWRPALYIDVISMTDSIHKGILKDPQVKVIFTELDNTTYSMIHTKKKGDGKGIHEKITYRDRWKWFKKLKVEKAYTLDIECTEAQKYEMLCEDMEYWKTRSEPWAQDLMLRMGSERKRMLAASKTDALMQLIKLHDHKRKVIFTGSKAQAKEVSDTAGEKYEVINSDFSKNVNLKTIKDFNDGKLDNLIAVKMLRESMNLSDIEVGFITQLDNQILSFVQILGRCFRSDHPLLYVLVVRNTQDENYLKTARQGLDDKFIKAMSLQKLINEVQSDHKAST